LTARLATLLIAVLALGTVPALAAVVPSTAASALLAAAGDSTGDSDGGDAGTPPAAAPVPDPFLAQVLSTCRDGASGDKGTFQRLEDAGWDLSVDGATQTPFYQAFNGEKDFDGVGTVDITYSLEVYPTLTEGYCSLSIDTAERLIGIADMKTMADLKGQYLETADGIASTWQDIAAKSTTFIQADQHANSLYFILDVTTLMEKPAAQIPYVKPTVPDATDMDNGDGPDTTNAAD
jgi:hypothetical protein